MGCQKLQTESQTEFEFFRAMSNSPDVLVCCGPITEIGFTEYSLSQFKRCLQTVGVGGNYLDSYDPKVLDSGTTTLAMCAKHWMRHAEAVGTLALQTQNSEWETLSYTMFRLVCLINEWDYKEIINYASTGR